jgi:hypothetical protein
MKTEPATPLPECIEGRPAFKRFDAAMKTILSVPHSEMLRREQEYKQKAALNPRKRGPKPKANSSRVSSDRAPRD